jgi:hypothetical protein
MSSILDRGCKKMLCSNCMKNWKTNGRDPEKKPKPLCQEEIKDGVCPVCCKKFRVYFPF